MPVARGRNQRVPSQGRLTQLANDIDQSAQTAQYVQCVCGCQHIEKRTAWIRGQVESLGAQLRPCDVLTSYKKQAKKQGYVEPACRVLSLTFQTAHESSDAAARDFQGNAAGEEQQGVEVEDRRQGEGLPVERRSFANNQGAGERGKHHGNGEKHYPDASRGWRRRVVERHTQVPIRRNQVPPTAVPRVPLIRQAVRIDLRRFMYRSCHNALNSPPDASDLC